MTIPASLLLTCLLLLMALGLYVVVTATRKRPRGGRPAELSLLGAKIVVKGPAWIVMLAIGCLMVAAPVLLAAAERQAQTPFEPPTSVNKMATIAEPDYSRFKFIRDVSELDLRHALDQPWYTRLPGASVARGKRRRIRPATLLNYMVVEKTADADSIHISYTTSGLLDLRCLTHPFKVFTAEDSSAFVGEIVADVRGIPVGQQFTIIVEATYWNAFSGAAGDDYTTYTHNQADPEELSVVILFPDAKPFRDIQVLEEPPGSQTLRSSTLPKRDARGPLSKTYYWTASNPVSGRWFFTTKWTW